MKPINRYLSTDLTGVVVKAIDCSSKPLCGAATAEPMRNQIFQHIERHRWRDAQLVGEWGVSKNSTFNYAVRSQSLDHIILFRTSRIVAHVLPLTARRGTGGESFLFGACLPQTGGLCMELRLLSHLSYHIC